MQLLTPQDPQVLPHRAALQEIFPSPSQHLGPPRPTRSYWTHSIRSCSGPTQPPHLPALCLQDNYGRKEPEKVAKVKELYEAVGMRAAFQQYEESSYRRLQELIEKHSNRLPKEIFLGLAQKIYKRQK